jgi:hypothetical protein
MIEPFDPQHLTPAASLNRLRIVDLPGVDLPTDVRGKTGYELASAAALSAMIREDFPQLASLDDRELPIQFDRFFESPAAERIARRLAQNVGYLLATLKRGDGVNRAVRSDCDETFWNHWAKIETVHFGGGLLSGNLGRRFADDLGAFWAEEKFPAMQFDVSPFGEALPLVGAASTVADGEISLVLDFGGSFVKRAIASKRQGEVVSLQMLPAVETRWQRSDDPKETGRAVQEFMVQTISQTWNVSLARTIPVSIAAYMRDGQPLERQGGDYSLLCRLSDCAEDALSKAISGRLGSDVGIHLLHDGTAAAKVYAGEQNAVVLTLGTAIGHGFPPRE